MTDVQMSVPDGDEAVSRPPDDGNAAAVPCFVVVGVAHCASVYVTFKITGDEDLYGAPLPEFVGWAVDCVEWYRSNVLRGARSGLAYVQGLSQALQELRSDQSWVGWLSEVFWTAEEIPHVAVTAAESAVAELEVALERGNALPHALERYLACDPAFDDQVVSDLVIDVLNDILAAMQRVQDDLLSANQRLLAYQQDVMMGAKIGELTFTAINVSAFAVFGIAGSMAVSAAGAGAIVAGGVSALGNVLSEAGKQTGQKIAGSRGEIGWEDLGKEALTGFFGAGEVVGAVGGKVLSLLPQRLELLARLVGDLVAKRLGQQLLEFMIADRFTVEFVRAMFESIGTNGWQLLVKSAVDGLAGGESPEVFTFEVFVKVAAEGRLPEVVEAMDLSPEKKVRLLSKLLELASRR